MPREHRYSASVQWTGNLGTGTSAYTAYARDHVVRFPGKREIEGSSDPAFRGDPARCNPEEMLVASLSACHMLWYLHLAAEAGLVVTAYEDNATGVMEEGGGRPGRFTSVVLHPTVAIAGPCDRAAAAALHDRAHEFCFIANSVNFPVTVEPVFI